MRISFIKKSLMAMVVCFLVVSSVSAGALDQAVNAFGKQDYYARPLATLLGSASNNGWYSSASIDKGFGFYIGLPISLSYIDKADRQATVINYDGGCDTCRQAQQANPTLTIRDSNCVVFQSLTVPTIFGTMRAPKAVKSKIDQFGNIVQQDSSLYSDGIKAMSDLPLMPLASLQLDFSYWHTTLKLRYIGLPIPGLSVNLPGFGIQHDISWLFDNVPIGVSLAYNMTMFMVDWAPGDNIIGSITLNGSSMFAGVLVGYQWQKIEVFAECGWEHASLNVGGNLTITGTTPLEVIKPDFLLTGRNMFRASLNFGFPIGYMPVIGGTAGTNWGNTVNIIAYKFQSK